MKYALIWTALILWCSSTHAQVEEVIAFDECPERGTVVSEEPFCGAGRGRWDKWERVANGQCGTFIRKVEENVVECGYTPGEPVCPLRGTDLDIRYCGDPNGSYFTRGDPLTQYTRIANGTCGTWRRTVEVNAEVCQPPPPPPVMVELVKAEGDRFKPVRFNVDAEDGYVVEQTDGMIGNVTVLPDQVLIHGNGATGTGYIVIAGEEYSYNIVPEPRCELMLDPKLGSGNVDCLGYIAGGPRSGFIYYGEDDDQIVEWELSLWDFDGRGEVPSDNQNLGYYIWERYEVGSVGWNRMQEAVDKYNRVYENSGVHIRFTIKEGDVGSAWYSGLSGITGLVRSETDVDIGLGRGNSCTGTCGCAYVSYAFPEETTSRVSVSSCGTYTDLHEIGHTVGLAHGPDNMTNAGEGYIWQEFGHGHSTPFCGNYADLMSYAPAGYVHMNSRLTCEEVFKTDFGLRESDYDLPAGSREYADSAYHLNRIRYDVSLLNCEEDKCRGKPEASPLPEEEGIQGPLVEDEIDDFANGREMYERARQQTEEFLRNNPQF